MTEITIRVTFGGNLTFFCGRSAEKIEVSEPTLKGLIEEMGRKWDPKIPEVLLNHDRESLRENIIVFVEGSSFDLTQSLLAPLKEGSHIIIAPVVGGG